MGRTYWVDLTPTAVTVAADLLEITAADDKPVEVLDQDILQTTELGDAAEEVIGLQWVRGNTTSGSGGSAPTPRPCDPDDAAAGFTAEVFNTTQASAGTAVNVGRAGWNVRVPQVRSQLPEGRPKTTQAAGLLVLRMAAAPADSVTISGAVLVREGLPSA